MMKMKTKKCTGKCSEMKNDKEGRFDALKSGIEKGKKFGNKKMAFGKKRGK